MERLSTQPKIPRSVGHLVKVMLTDPKKKGK